MAPLPTPLALGTPPTAAASPSLPLTTITFISAIGRQITTPPISRISRHNNISREASNVDAMVDTGITPQSQPPPQSQFWARPFCRGPLPQLPAIISLGSAGAASSRAAVTSLEQQSRIVYSLEPGGSSRGPLSTPGKGSGAQSVHSQMYDKSGFHRNFLKIAAYTKYNPDLQSLYDVTLWRS